VHDPHALRLYVDGSAYNNPGHEGGLSVFAEYPDSLGLEASEVVSKTFTETTNNRMELRACIEALKFARGALEKYKIGRAIVVTDSQYVYDNQTRAPTWKANDWRNQSGRRMDNSDLWNEFLLARSKVRAYVEVVWQAGKTTPILKEVDKGAKKQPEGLVEKTLVINKVASLVQK